MKDVVNTMSNKFSDLFKSDEFKEEFFVAEAQARLQMLLEDRGVTRAELSRKLGVSRARVTQIFSDDAKNLTLRLLARSFIALGEEPVVLEKSEYERLVRCAEEEKSNRKVRHRTCTDGQEDVLTASLIAEALRSSEQLHSSEGDKLSRRSSTAKTWAEYGSNVVPMRRAANG
ncbi:helix-turn-helix domain-containing protein [Qipengyuania marisflavi]|uniref:Helix-turn-helix transcriptional regulator n=1 Tax=Qipengyuania marisflavi TaxID=2486356 RepID=A0A5S3P9L8_9SPHN|nr:helix-turn-helix transcriptional regulator [Qipengyuania marisflavi]TMM50194.1 helix-turn-helix transcriptional regulator [Qipengyuania marisflavi]